MEQENIIYEYQNLQNLVIQALQYTDKKSVDMQSKIPISLKNEINKEMDVIFDFITAYLLRYNDYAFYGVLLIGTVFKTDYQINGVIDSKIEKDPIEIHINPLKLTELNIHQLIGKIINETIKLIMLHPEMYRNLNPSNDPKSHDMLEDASDADSSNILLDAVLRNGGDGSITLPNDISTTSKLSEEFNRDLNRKESMDYYYKAISAYRKADHKQSKNNKSASDNDSSSDENGNPVHQWERASSSNVDDLKHTIQNAYNGLSEKQRGLVPDSMVEQIQNFFKKPVIPWQQILKNEVGTLSEPYRRTKMRQNRIQPDRFDLMGRLPKHKVRIVCCLDTSGSMSDNDLKYCMNEVFGILKDYSVACTVIECDAEVGRVYTAKNTHDYEAKCSKVTGRGGTSYVPAIEYINAHNFRDALMIYFTDGYGDDSIPKPHTHKNIWVVLQDAKNLSVKEPYGKVLSLKDDPKFKENDNNF